MGQWDQTVTLIICEAVDGDLKGPCLAVSQMNDGEGHPHTSSVICGRWFHAGTHSLGHKIGENFLAFAFFFFFFGITMLEYILTWPFKNQDRVSKLGQSNPVWCIISKLL